MSIGYTLSENEYNQVQGQYYSEYQFFNCVLSIDNIWFLFLSDEDKSVIMDTEWNWILSLPQAEYVPPPAPPFPPIV
jgi:hypothetical protein